MPRVAHCRTSDRGILCGARAKGVAPFWYALLLDMGAPGAACLKCYTVSLGLFYAREYEKSRRPALVKR